MQQSKKTIIMTVGDGVVTRNLLLNSFFNEIKAKYKVVILTPLYQDKDFLKRFGNDGVIVEELVQHEPSKIENIFIALHKALIYNPTIRIKSRYGLTRRQKKEMTWKKHLVNNLEYLVYGLFLARFRFLRDFLKKIDAAIFKTNYYEKILKKYQPIAVFITNITSNFEIYLLREARKMGILSLGMTRSWDNFSKVGIRDKVDEMIVWSDYMKDEVEYFQNYKKDKITVVGIPQFDIYHDIITKYTRTDFINTYRLDVDKKTILFGPISGDLSPDDHYIAAIIKDWIVKNGKNYQLLIRPHLKHDGTNDLFDDITDNRVVFVDKIATPSKFRDNWDLSPEHHLRLALSMRFSEVVLTSVSTLVLDALASDNTIISYYFDKDKHIPYGDSIRRLFETLWFAELQKYGLRKFMVNNENELLHRIEEILEKHWQDGAEEQKKIIARFCYRIDGQAGRRLFDFIDHKIMGLKNEK